MSYKDVYNEWLESDYFDEETKQELRNIDDEKEIEDRFYCELNFGTAGLRGLIGAGTNRMNKYTVMKATQGLANYLHKKNIENPSVAISYDSRNYSYDFALYTALVFNANGIKTYLSDVLRPVPVLSFMVRDLKTTVGVMITASHNPKEYNGYKVYWSDGCQINAPVDNEIIEEVNSIKDYNSIKLIDEKEAREKGLFNVVSKDIDDRFLETIKKESINPNLCKEYGKDINIVYTPLNGAGNVLVRRVLNEIGFTNVHVVPEQELPDGNFTTVPRPNPEYNENYELAIKIAEKVNADVILATDPDADRFGIAVKDKDGSYVNFTGNMVGSMLCEYILSSMKENGTLPSNGLVIKTIVTSNLVKMICDNYGVDLVNVLIGFKYIGEQINMCEDGRRDNTFIFGLEESMGYLKGKYIRDKDGVVAAMLFAELTAYCKKNNITLIDYMNSIYDKYHYYLDKGESRKFPGVDGKKEMDELMRNYKENYKTSIAGVRVTRFIDYSTSTAHDLTNNTTSTVNLPKSNIAFYDLEDGSFVCIRPSGNEPIIKYYFNISGKNYDEAKEKLENFKKEFLN